MANRLLKFLSRKLKRKPKPRFDIGDDWKRVRNKAHSGMLLLGDIQNIDAFSKTLREAKDPLSKYLRTRFESKTKNLIDNPSSSRDKLERYLVRDLNFVIHGLFSRMPELRNTESLYTEDRFAHVSDNNEFRKIKKRLENRPKDYFLAPIRRDNRALLSLAYKYRDDKGESKNHISNAEFHTDLRWAFSKRTHRNALLCFANLTYDLGNYLGYMCIAALPHLDFSNLEEKLEAFTRVFLEPGGVKDPDGEDQSMLPEAPLLVNLPAYTSGNKAGKAAYELYMYFRKPKSSRRTYDSNNVLSIAEYENFLFKLCDGLELIKAEIGGAKGFTQKIVGDPGPKEAFLRHYSRYSGYKDTDYGDNMKNFSFNKDKPEDKRNQLWGSYFKARKILSRAGFPMDELCGEVDGLKLQ